MAHCKIPAGVFVPVIDPNKCEAKGPCINVCPYGVFELGKLAKEKRKDLHLIGKIKGFVHGWQQAQVVQPDLCQACNLCVKACPEQAIRLVPAKQK